MVLFVGIPIGLATLDMVPLIFIIPLIIWGDFVENSEYMFTLFTKMEIVNIDVAKTLLTWAIVPLIIGIISIIVYIYQIIFGKNKNKIALIISLIFFLITFVMVFIITYI